MRAVFDEHTMLQRWLDGEADPPPRPRRPHASPRRASPRHAHGGTYPRAASAPDHVRFQGGDLDGGTPPWAGTRSTGYSFPRRTPASPGLSWTARCETPAG